MRTTDVFLRPAGASDAERLHQLHTASVRQLCRDHYAPEIIDGWLMKRSADINRPVIELGDIFVAIRGDGIVGFSEAVPGEIRAVCVDPAVTGMGVGTLLMQRAMDV